MRRLTGLVLVVLLVVACGGDDDSSNGDGGGGGDAQSAEGAWPVTVEHAHGETTIDERPERIVSLNVQWTDVLLAMGVEPAGYLIDRSSGEEGIYPWEEGQLDGSTEIVQTDSMPVERIAALQPDLILVTWATQQDPELYDRLSEIAPTVPPLQESEAVDPWQDLIEVAGRFLGEEDRSQQVIDEVDGQAAAIREELPGLEGKTYTLANYVPGDAITVVADPEDGASLVFGQLGMELNPRILERADGAAGRIEVSFEQVELLDSDMLLVLPNDGDPGDLPGWDDLPAVASGAVTEMNFQDVTGLNTPTPLSIPYVLDLIRPALEATAGQ
jgi:iron complex transport system substrate-binding protein